MRKEIYICDLCGKEYEKDLQIYDKQNHRTYIFKSSGKCFGESVSKNISDICWNCFFKIIDGKKLRIY